MGNAAAIEVDVRRVVEIVVVVPAAIEVETVVEKGAIGGPAVTGARKARLRSTWIS